jgi:four helix bundle protein
MNEDTVKNFNLEKRTFLFAVAVRDYVDKLPGKITNQEIGRQLIRSAGSVGANYIEANEAFSKKDFVFRIKICRKEVKESCFWLKLSFPLKMHEDDRMKLIDESQELVKIFSAIINKAKYQVPITK